MELDFEIDKITESIEDSQTGEVYKTLVLPITDKDLMETVKQNGWLFDWKFEYLNPKRKVYKLIAEQEPNKIQGMVSFEKQDNFVFMHLIESAPFNIGFEKKYLGVACNLVAFICKLSKEYGFEGVVCYEPKTALIPHYEKTLGAVLINKNRMAIFEDNANFLINKYFPDEEE